MVKILLHTLLNYCTINDKNNSHDHILINGIEPRTLETFYNGIKEIDFIWRNSNIKIETFDWD